jgi:hypothetical protein
MHIFKRIKKYLQNRTDQQKTIESLQIHLGVYRKLIVVMKKISFQLPLEKDFSAVASRRSDLPYNSILNSHKNKLRIN